MVIFRPFDNLLKGGRTLFLIKSFDNKTNQWNRKYFETNDWSNGTFSETAVVPIALQSFDKKLHRHGIHTHVIPFVIHIMLNFKYEIFLSDSILNSVLNFEY